MADISIGDGGINVGDFVTRSTFFELPSYTILNDIAYSLGTGVISYRNITRITYNPSVQYQDGTIDLYLMYTYGGLLGITDSTGYDSIVDSLSLTEVSGYNIQNNRAVPVGGDGIDFINTTLVNKVVIIPNIDLDGKPITIYACFDVSNNIITYTDLLGYSTITGLGLYTYNVSVTTYQSGEEACTNGPNAESMNVYSTGDTIDDRLILYTDTSLTTPYYSEGIVYITSSTAKSRNMLQQIAGGSQYSISTRTNGTVETLAECITPTPTPTPTMSETPLPTPIMSFSFSVRRNNTGPCASSPITTIYSNSSVLETGINVYEDISLTNPLPAYTHICDCINRLDYIVSIDNILSGGDPTTCIQETPTPTITPTPTMTETPLPTPTTTPK